MGGRQCVVFFLCKNHVADFARQGFLDTGYQLRKVQGIHLPDDLQVDDAPVQAPGEASGEIDFAHIAKLAHHPLDDLVDTDVLHQDAVQLVEQRVPLVGRVNLLIAFGFRGDHTGVLKLVQLQADRIGALAELFLQSAQIRPVAGVQKELQQQLYTGF